MCVDAEAKLVELQELNEKSGVQDCGRSAHHACGEADPQAVVGRNAPVLQRAEAELPLIWFCYPEYLCESVALPTKPMLSLFSMDKALHNKTIDRAGV